MNVLYLAQAASQDDINIITDSLSEKDTFTLLSGSNVRINRGKVIKVSAHDSKSMMSRLKCWIKYRTDVVRWAKKTDDHFDVIYANSNPPINSFLGVKLKKKFNAPFIYMNWDIYPQIVEMSTNNPAVKIICKIWHKANRRLYKKIDQMLTIGSVIAESINKPLREKIDIHIVPMWADVENIKPMPKEDNLFIKDNGLEGKFIVLYSGKLGYGHNITAILDAAERLESNNDICFVFIGKGPKCEEVQQRINEGSRNIRLFPYQPESMLKYSISCGDIGMVSQEEKLAHLFLPSKAYTLMSCGIPLIGLCSEHDDLRRLIDDNEVGISICRADGNKVADAILKLYNNKNECAKMGQNARRLVIEKYSRNAVKNRYKEEFDETISRRTL